jgi:hypothetical protein
VCHGGSSTGGSGCHVSEAVSFSLDVIVGSLLGGLTDINAA